jgi:hypothetical protein
MYIEIMFADKNNHLIKQILKQKRRDGGGESLPRQDMSTPEETPQPKDMSLAKTLPFTESEEISTPIDPATQNSVYPDTNYLYKNITSNKDIISKTNVCAFYLQDTNFIKFIVETRDKRAMFPSFVFEASQRGGFLDEDSETSDLDKQFQENVIGFVKSFFKSKQEGGEIKQNVSMTLQDDERPKLSEQPDDIVSSELNEPPVEPLDQPQVEPLDEPQVEPPVELQVEPLDEPQVEPLDEPQVEPLDEPQVEPLVEPLDQPQVEPLDEPPVEPLDQPQVEPLDEPPVEPLDEPQVEPQVTYMSLLEDTVYDNLEYIGYLMFNNEQFVFVNIGSPKPLVPEYRETLLNELFYTFKVFDTDVDTTVRDLFDNNRWLLNEDQPYSGYMCALNEANQLVNVKVDEPNADLINVESIGDYYYFSFLPLDKQSDDNENTYKRFAIFPNEYVCILDDSQMEQYQANKLSYAQDKTIYLKGETLRDKKTGHEFMCVKTPSQFTQY